MNEEENKPIEAYLSKKFSKKIKSKNSLDSNSSHSKNETQIENECNKSKLSNFSLENEDDNYSVEDGSSFNSSFDEIETGEIDESLLIKTEHH